MWSGFANCIAELDCLCTLARVSKENNFVKPKILDIKKLPELNITGLKHPCVARTVKSFVENDI